MAALCAYATNNYGDDDTFMFAVAVEGNRVGVVFPAIMYSDAENGYEADEVSRSGMLNAISSRLGLVREGAGPEQVLRAISYNMPVQMEVGEEFETFDEAARNVVSRMSLKDYDEYPRDHYEVFEPTAPQGRAGNDEEEV